MSAARQWEVGEKVRARRGCDHFYSVGDVGAVASDEGDGTTWVDFKAGPQGQHVHNDGVWAVDSTDLEPV